jgi:hypothetical protein
MCSEIMMSDTGDLKARAFSELRQLQELFHHWISASDSNSSNTDDLKIQITARLAQDAELFASLSTLPLDDEVQPILNEFERLKSVLDSPEAFCFSPPDEPGRPDEEISLEPDANEVPPRIRKPNNVIGDFLWSFLWTILICVFFAAVWTKYSNTH